MNWGRRIQRQNLKTQIKKYEEVIRGGSRENTKIDRKSVV